MRSTSVNTRGKVSNSGFSLVKLVVVIAIMSILIAIGVPNYIGYKEKAKKEICRTNCLQIERIYYNIP